MVDYLNLNTKEQLSEITKEAKNVGVNVDARGFIFPNATVELMNVLKIQTSKNTNRKEIIIGSNINPVEVRGYLDDAIIKERNNF